jgi:tRNA modification GTPase
MSNTGIGIIRVSGEDAIKITAKIFPDVEQMKSHTIKYGFLLDGQNVIDEAMVSLMKAPHSYTREDVVEINCHGGVTVMRTILDCLIRNGARLAEPGEFTKRAFLNGRLDLAEAGAVMDVIRARNEFALKCSVKQLTGAVSRTVRELRAEILRQTAYIEAALDDPEHYSLEDFSAELAKNVENIIAQLEQTLATANQGKILKDGINTAIVGKPNVGKSSFLNLLLGEDRAIVTEIAGTTRDILTESAMVGKVMLNIADTAGIRQTQDIIEVLGVERTVKCLESADLVVFMLDSAAGIDENDREICELVRGKTVIVLLNKVDIFPPKISENELVDIVDRVYKQGDNVGEKPTVIWISAKNGTGIEDFHEAVQGLFLHGASDNESETYITSLRHVEMLSEACASMYKVSQGIKAKMPEDLLTIDLMNAYASLGRIIGEEVDDDLVAEIFAEFCVGK